MGHHYRQLTQEERYQIGAMKGLGISQAEIARRLGRSASTVSRELGRNGGCKRYEAEAAQRKSDKRRRQARKYSKHTPALVAWVDARLREQWSPEQISGSMRAHGYSLVSHEWIYRHIARDQAQGGTLWRELRHRRKKYRKRYGSGKRSSRIPNRVGIEERPAEVDTRSRQGDWEGDTVVGPSTAALVTLVERKTGLVMIRRVTRATADLTAKATVSALSPWDPLTLTFDNGTEFAHHEKVAKQLKCKIYFARPYHSWERGTNENTNGLIRQYFRKGTDFSKVTDEEVQWVENKLNLRPRKRLGYQAPIELLARSQKQGQRCS